MLLQNIRAKIGARLSGEGEAGFTLIELLVVMLILGILAAIALPAFFNQKSKASDAKAKEYDHTAQVAAETYATEHSGKYTSMDATALKAIEPTLASAPGLVAEPKGTGAEGYKVLVTGSASTQEFWIEREPTTQKLVFGCKVASTGGCPAGGNWENG